jgi:hypothetical protein
VVRKPAWQSPFPRQHIFRRRKLGIFNLIVSGTDKQCGWITATYNQSLILTNDFAVAGSVVQDAITQMKTQYVPNQGRKPSWSPWSATDSIFRTYPLCHSTKLTFLVPYIGNNDCISGDLFNLTNQLNLLFSNLDLLYNTGARNYLFMNVLPFDRSPYGIATIQFPF